MADDLYRLIFGILHGMSHAQMSQEPGLVAGLVVPAPEGFSKRQRIELALENLTQADLARLALKLLLLAATSRLMRRAARCLRLMIHR